MNNLDINDLIKDYNVDSFISRLNSDHNGRDYSYEHCRSFFISNRHCENKKDEMALHLYCYLASWGMLRNSFLMYKDYKFLVPVVEILNKPEFDNLLYFDPNSKSNRDTVFELKGQFYDCFKEEHYFKDSKEQITISKVTDTLITKILLGTFGCAPAYDTYFCMALRRYCIKDRFNQEGFEGLINAITSWSRIHHMAEKINKNQDNDFYTPMKVIDMVLWAEGFRLNKIKKQQEADKKKKTR